MVKLEAKKDGNGNIIITEDSFEYLLNCLDNQKFIAGQPEENQHIIDDFNSQCRDILNQHIVIDIKHYGLSLCKKYDKQDDLIKWLPEDVYLIDKILSSDTKLYIECPLMYDSDYLTISVDHINNRPWTELEIQKIKNLFKLKNKITK